MIDIRSLPVFHWFLTQGIHDMREEYTYNIHHANCADSSISSVLCIFVFFQWSIISIFPLTLFLPKLQSDWSHSFCDLCLCNVWRMKEIDSFRLSLSFSETVTWSMSVTQFVSPIIVNIVVWEISGFVMQRIVIQQKNRTSLEERRSCWEWFVSLSLSLNFSDKRQRQTRNKRASQTMKNWTLEKKSTLLTRKKVPLLALYFSYCLFFFTSLSSNIMFRCLLLFLSFFFPFPLLTRGQQKRFSFEINTRKREKVR